MVGKHSLNGSWQAVFVEPGLGDDKRLFVEPLAVDGWFEAAVPGDVHADLHRHGMIPDPYLADNLERCRWTQTKDCWFHRTFMVPNELMHFPALELVFDGIDTIAEVWLNDRYLGRCENMFRRFRFDVSNIIDRNRGNQVTVKIGSLDEARKPFRGQRRYRAIKDQSRVYFRKPQCQFGWDWSPEFGSIGIWKDVNLLGHSGTRIESASVETKLSGEITIHVALNRPLRGGEVDFLIEGHGEQVTHTRSIDGTRTFAALKLDRPRIWWPNGYGDQPLYSCTVTVKDKARVIDEDRIRFGIRELEHVERRVSDDEVSWLLLVNGEEVFCQGANWVPPDIFPGAIPPERYRSLLTKAKEAGFNMIRIWGGGMYESDLFYDLCDELGLMVWQDFAFANADYPLDQEEWRRNATAEIKYQVERLRNHPSLAVWCGGNEKSSSFEIEHAIDDGFDLFGVHIPGLLNLLDTTRPYVISSPIAYTDVGNDRSSGNSHTSVWLWAYFDNVNVEPFREWLNPPPAFKSEFFLMGATRAESFRKMMTEGHVWPPDEVWAHKFRGAPEWNKGRMVSFHEYQFNTVEKFFGRPKNLSEFLKFSSVCQRELAREEFEHTRAHRHRCGGALFWMMNSTWPAPLWELVDFYGVPKPVFYAFKRACAPLSCLMTVVDGDYVAFVCNDTGKKVSGTVEIDYQVVDGETLFSKSIPFEADGHASVEVFRIPRSEWTEPNAYVHLQLTSDDGKVEDFYYPMLWKGLKLSDPEVSVKLSDVQPDGDGYSGKVIVTNKRFARCVFVDLDPLSECTWEDNFFDLAPGLEKVIQVWCPRKFNEKDLQVGHWLTEWD
jgi:beta-mannosidase